MLMKKGMHSKCFVNEDNEEFSDRVELEEEGISDQEINIEQNNDPVVKDIPQFDNKKEQNT